MSDTTTLQSHPTERNLPVPWRASRLNGPAVLPPLPGAPLADNPHPGVWVGYLRGGDVPAQARLSAHRASKPLLLLTAPDSWAWRTHTRPDLYFAARSGRGALIITDGSRDASLIPWWRELQFTRADGQSLANASPARLLSFTQPTGEQDPGGLDLLALLQEEPTGTTTGLAGALVDAVLGRRAGTQRSRLAEHVGTLARSAGTLHDLGEALRQDTVKMQTVTLPMFSGLAEWCCDPRVGWLFGPGERLTQTLGHAGLCVVRLGKRNNSLPENPVPCGVRRLFLRMLKKALQERTSVVPLTVHHRAPWLTTGSVLHGMVQHQRGEPVIHVVTLNSDAQATAVYGPEWPRLRAELFGAVLTVPEHAPSDSAMLTEEQRAQFQPQLSYSLAGPGSKIVCLPVILPGFTSWWKQNAPDRPQPG